MEEKRTLVEKLCSRCKLDRDCAIQELSQLKLTDEETKFHETLFVDVLCSAESCWEAKYGCLAGLKTIVNANSEDYWQKLKPICVQLLHDKEARVRLAIGELLGALCKFIGTDVYESLHNDILSSVEQNLTRSVSVDKDSKEADRLIEKLLTSHTTQQTVDAHVISATEIYHDTAGWQHLETSVKALQFMIDGCDEKFLPYFDERLMNLLRKILSNKNRFVRETGFYICSSLLKFTNKTKSVLNLDDKSSVWDEKFAYLLATGLSDSWSQVRLGACFASQQFFLFLGSIENQENYFPVLLAPLCLNRYHLAEGVRLHAQQTWSMIFGENGRSFVEKYIDHVIKYYLDELATSDNYTVRLSCCQCLAELAQKINKEAVRKHVTFVLQTLSGHFEDVSWQVRDACSLACEKFVCNFPTESRDLLTYTLLPLYYKNLHDIVPLVSSGTAESLSKIIDTYGLDFFVLIFPTVINGLKEIDAQPTVNSSTVECVEHVAKVSEKTAVCTCTIYLKIKHDGACILERKLQPWEITEGWVQLTSELTGSTIQGVQAKVAGELVHLIVNACQKRDYGQHLQFMETVCNRIPQMAKNLKRHFKPLLDDFIEPIFYALTCERVTTENAASRCIHELVHIFGVNILKAKIERINAKYLPLYEKILEKTKTA